jgi:C-terminal processing protease CtpA/Prc
MFRELGSSHLDFSAIALADAFPTRGGSRAAGSTSQIHWVRLAPGFGYLRIAEFDEGEDALRSVDSAFAALRAATGIVIDVRGNPGGTLGAAMRVGDYLLDSLRPVGYFATRAGLSARGARSMDDLDPSRLPVYAGYAVEDFQRVLRREGAVTIVTGGRVSQPYRGRVVLLVDQRSGSTTEAFAAVLKELRRATLIGRTTAGSMLSSTEVPIVGGWVVRVPEADFRTPRGERVEGRGVATDLAVRHRRFQDAELRRAVAFLRTGQ